jgi:hypothetical protein
MNDVRLRGLAVHKVTLPVGGALTTTPRGLET